MVLCIQTHFLVNCDRLLDDGSGGRRIPIVCLGQLVKLRFEVVRTSSNELAQANFSSNYNAKDYQVIDAAQSL